MVFLKKLKRNLRYILPVFFVLGFILIPLLLVYGIGASVSETGLHWRSHLNIYFLKTIDLSAMFSSWLWLILPRSLFKSLDVMASAYFLGFCGILTILFYTGKLLQDNKIREIFSIRGVRRFFGVLALVFFYLLIKTFLFSYQGFVTELEPLVAKGATNIEIVNQPSLLTAGIRYQTNSRFPALDVLHGMRNVMREMDATAVTTTDPQTFLWRWQAFPSGLNMVYQYSGA